MATIRLFASVREAAGTSSVATEATTVEDALTQLANDFGPSVQSLLSTCRVWVNGESAPLDQPLGDGDELAVLPPVSGGSD